MGKVAAFETERARRVRIKTPSNRPCLRHQQRVSLAMDITLEQPDGPCVTCQASNISRSGLTVCCDQEAVRQLIPGMRPPAPGNWTETKARFSLPVLPTEQPVAVCTDAHIVHMRRVSRNKFELGIQFCEFEGNGFDYVDKYVARLLIESKRTQ